MARASRSVGRSLSSQLPWWGFIDDRLLITRSGRLLGFSRLVPLPADGLSGADVDQLVAAWSRVLMALGPDVRLWWVVDRWRAPSPAVGEAAGDLGRMAAGKRRAHVAERVREYSSYLVWEFDRGLARRVATAEGGRRWLLDYARNWWHSRRNPHVTAILRSVLADVARDVRNELAGLEARLSTGTTVVAAKAPEAVRVLHRLSNAGQGEWVDGLATRYGLNWRLASADVSITRRGVTVGDQLVRVWSLASAPGQVVGNCLDGLYGLNADLSVVLGWRGTDRQGARRRISSAQHHYHQARHSLMSAMGEGGEATGLEDFGAASEVQVLGQALVDLQSGDVCFGEMHLSVAVRAPGELEFAEINAALERVVGGIDGKLVRETHGLPAGLVRAPARTDGGHSAPALLRQLEARLRARADRGPAARPRALRAPRCRATHDVRDPVGHAVRLRPVRRRRRGPHARARRHGLGKELPPQLPARAGAQVRPPGAGARSRPQLPLPDRVRRRALSRPGRGGRSRSVVGPPEWASSPSGCPRPCAPASSSSRGSSGCWPSGSTRARRTMSPISTSGSPRCSAARRRSGRSARSPTCLPRRMLAGDEPGGWTRGPGLPGSTARRRSSRRSAAGRSWTSPARRSMPTGARPPSGSCSSACGW